jgi:hypothetical protein
MIADVFTFCKLFIYVYLFKLRLVFRVDISSSESKLDAETWQIPPDLRTCFYIDGCATRRAVALRRRIFKQKKGFANLSLGLNYHSKAFPQPPSRDTVPLRQYVDAWALTYQRVRPNGFTSTTQSLHLRGSVKLNGPTLRIAMKGSFWMESLSSTFLCCNYLGSIVSENSGMEEDTCYGVLQAQFSLNKYNAILKSDLKLWQKVGFLKYHIFPSMV